MALTDDELADMRTHADACECPMGYLARLLDEVDRLRALLDPPAWREDRDTALRAAVAKAITNLDGAHPLERGSRFTWCGTCEHPWPCVPGRVADDLRKAVQ